MFTQPNDLTDVQVSETVFRGWGQVVDKMAYAAVGFGSHHWFATVGSAKWFVTVDDLDARHRDLDDSRMKVRQRLSAALETARSLQQSGKSFVIAPVTNTAGSVLENVDDRFVLALYPHVCGRPGSTGRYDSQVERFEVIDRLIEIHTSTETVKGMVGVDDFSIPSRDQLNVALAETTSPWSQGPYSEPTRALLQRHAGDITTVLNRYDQLVELVKGRGGAPVVTHGEPHRGNVIFTSEGASLIDWETALLAPRERDLWSLVDEDQEVAAYYSTRSGSAIDTDVLALYRLWWDLCEISQYVAEFCNPHTHSADTRTAWQELTRYVDPTRWSDRE